MKKEQEQHTDAPDYDLLTNEQMAEDVEAGTDEPDYTDEADGQGDRQQTAPPKERDDREALRKAIQETAREDERPSSASNSLRKILGGDILSTKFLRKQIWTIIIVTVFLIIYVGNRYSCQKKMLTINHLNKELQDQRYKMLSVSSDLTERCRETQVLQMLRENNDTTLHISDIPPYVIEIPEE